MDTIGSDAPIELSAPPATLGELECGTPPANELANVLRVTDSVVKIRVEQAFQQLFYGDPDTESFYFTYGEDQAYVWDPNHNDVRTEGMGLAMLIAVKLDKQDEFDRLWRFSLEYLRVSEGPAAGYFRSKCDTLNEADTVPCFDPYGMQQFLMALVFAHHRWGSAGDIDYESDALALLELMRGKEQQNGGAIVDDVTDVFDDDAHLPYDEPVYEAATYTRPAAVMPAYYHQWASVTGQRFWRDASAAGRAFWQRVADPDTGLMPTRAEFDGTPVSGWESFAPEGYRAQVNLALDRSWGSQDEWEVDESNHIVDFFAARADDGFCRTFTLDGTTCLDTEDMPALPIVNALTAVAATSANRVQLIQSFWALGEPPTGYSRYYGGLLYLITLMVAGGLFPVCDVN